MAGGSRIRLFTVFTLQAEAFGLIEARLSEGHVIAQTVREHFLPQFTEIVAPADVFGDSGGVTEVRRVHQLEVLFILSRSASGDLIDPLAEMPMIGTAEFRESIEEMIVACHS